MTGNISKVTIQLVSSLDGIIGKNDNGVPWFEIADYYEKGIADPILEEFVQSIDCYVMGYRTYEHTLKLSKSFGWVYGDVPTIIVTHREFAIERQSIELYSGDLHTLVDERLKPSYRNIWLVGGAMLAKDFIRLGLADEVRLTVLPIIMGDGILAFDRIGQELALNLKDVNAYQSGVVDLRYEIRK
jgi:dihydrofolate reductase